MAKHLNNTIAELGKTAAIAWMAAHEYRLDDENKFVRVPIMSGTNKPLCKKDIDDIYHSHDLVSMHISDVKACLLVVSTKQYQVKQSENVTGLDSARIAKLQTEMSKLKLDDIFVVFVDTKIGLIMGDMLSSLMKERDQFGIRWPMVERTHVGEVTFFSLYHIPTLARISEELKEKLGHLAAQNRVDKNQGYLFG